MKLLVTSIAGEPRNPSTWSNAPANLIAGLEQAGVDVTTLDNSTKSRLLSYAMAGAAMLTGFPPRQFARSAIVRNYRAKLTEKAFQASDCDVVLTTGSLDVPRNSSIPYAIWMDNTWDLYSRSKIAPALSERSCKKIDALERGALKGAKKILVFSQHIAENIAAHYEIVPEKIAVVGCGSGTMPNFRGAKDYQKGHFLFVAKHQFEEKGGFIATETFKLIRRARPNAIMKVVGSEQAISALKGIEGIETFGFVDRDKLISLFHEASFLIQPMLGDSWGQVYLEAMKSKAVVATWRAGAIDEITENGKLAIITAQPDPQALAAAVLDRLGQSAEFIEAIALAAQKKVETHYNWEVVTKNVLNALGNVS